MGRIKMKQHIAVRALVRSKGKTLLLRRAAGRESIVGKYELPGGKLRLGEQPEDALKRIFKDELGVQAATLQLYDVMTYIDKDDQAAQYLFVLYLASVAGDEFSLNEKYDRYEWKRVSEIQQEDMTESTNLLIGISANDGRDDNSSQIADVNDTTSMIVYSDGGSRGNPGPSASAYVVMNASKEILAQGHVYLGLTTNNQAEYHGVRLGLEKALELGAKKIDFRSDSMLVVNQMNGIYAIRNRELWPIYERIKELTSQFDKVTFTHVRRELNSLADGLVNKTLNEHADDSI
jgi:mutator protein MutT